MHDPLVETRRVRHGLRILPAAILTVGYDSYLRRLKVSDLQLTFQITLLRFSPLRVQELTPTSKTVDDPLVQSNLTTLLSAP